MADNKNQQPNNNLQSNTPQQQPDVSTTPSADSADGVPMSRSFSAEGIEFNPQEPTPVEQHIPANKTLASNVQQENTPTISLPQDQPLQPPKEPDGLTEEPLVEKPPIVHSMQLDSARTLKSEPQREPDDDQQQTNANQDASAQEELKETPSPSVKKQTTAGAQRPGAARTPVTPIAPETKQENKAKQSPAPSSIETPQTEQLGSKSEKKATKKLGNLDALRARVSELATERSEEPDLVFDVPKREAQEIQVEDIEAAQQQATTAVTDEIGAQEGKEAKQGALEKIKSATQNTVVPPIRTYKEDVAKALKSKDTSYIGIIAKEQERRTKQKEDKVERRRGKVLYGIGALVSGLLVISGIATLVYVLVIDNGTPTTLPPEEVPTLVFVDDQNEVDVTNLGRRAFLRILTNEKDAVNGSLGSVEQLYLVKEQGGLEPEPRTTLLTSREFFEGLEARVPGSFLRALGTDMTLASHVFNGNQAILITSITFYENAFAGMLDWERFMNQDLAPLFGPEVDLAQEVATSSPLSQIPFRDEVLRNKEIRVLRNLAGDVILLYSFIDRQTLVITTNENSFIEVVSRITTSRI